MSDRMTEEEFLKYSKMGLYIPVWIKLPADNLTPNSIFQSLQKNYERAFLQDSIDTEQESRQCSIIGFDPFLRIETRKNNLTIVQGKEITRFKADPFETVRKIVTQNQTIPLSGHPTLVGGAMGYFSYDSIRLKENIPDRHSDPNDYPDILFNFYKTVISYDYLEKKVCIYIKVKPEGNLKQLYANTIEAIEELIREMRIPYEAVHKECSAAKVEADPNDETFNAMVEKAQQYIHRGDIFQVVLSRNFTVKTEADPFDIYIALQKFNPSLYLFYIKELDYQIAGSSPERLVSLRDGIVKTNPLAGTTRRPTPELAAQVEQELLNDPKETAEHMMLVDLGRNDIGSISEIGTVKVTELKSILQLSHLIHISSEVEGKIRSDLDGLDAVRALLPAGTLSGAPKIRAMEIIDELETSKRGIYGGAICYLDNLGNIDTCIAIRMILLRDGFATVRAGAGIVYDSIPQKEANETRHKATSALNAVRLAESTSVKKAVV